ncbi:hypothetical protein ElyMa_004493900 [Elysia marginata]|uniref:Uncharacterized protein n=1 Tax=Elysia marginata TaxID=1093978 RepID=A0AAV4HMY2_9GAST|nr:hypothetical protein ElyMa_004493900 [Elysia marginata]
MWPVIADLYNAIPITRSICVRAPAERTACARMDATFCVFAQTENTLMMSLRLASEGSVGKAQALSESWIEADGTVDSDHMDGVITGVTLTEMNRPSRNHPLQVGSRTDPGTRNFYLAF